MRRLLTIFSMLVLVAVAFASEGNETNISQEISVPENQTVSVNETSVQNSNGSMPLEELVSLQADEIRRLREQLEILNAEIQELRRENAELKERIAELEKKPVTWDDVEETVNTYYVMFTYWTGWIWPILAFYLIFRYRKPAREEEAERIEEAAEKVAKEKQREWFSFQIRERGIESVAEDETELSIFRALGINTIGDLLEADDTTLLESFRRKYHPSADLEEHFKNRLKAIRESIKKEVE